MIRISRLVACLLVCLFAFNICVSVSSAEEDTEIQNGPIRVICTAEILANSGTLNDIEAYYKFLYDFSRDISREKKADAVILGGDIMGEQMTESAWRYYSKRLSEIVSEASETVLYASGNTDYYVGEETGYNSADYIGTVMADRLGELPYWDVYLATVNGEEYPLAYRYYVGGYYFYFLNTAPGDMAGALRYGNYVYSQDALNWIEKKMDVDDPDGDKLMFLIAHFPLEGDGSLSGALESGVSERLTNICAGHSNLIYLYSNDSNAVIDTSEKVVQYNTEGLVLSENSEEGLSLASQWTFVSYGDGTYAIYSCQSGKYLAVKDGTQLVLSDELSVWNIKQENGRIYITDASGVNGIKVPKTGTPTFTLGQATPFELYERSDESNETVYRYSTDIESGGVYAIVSDSKYALKTNRIGGIVKAMEVRVMGNLLRETERKTSVDGEAGFTSVYMGSASSRNMGMQYLTLDIYGDRVEMTLGNYGADGSVTKLVPYSRAIVEVTPPETLPGPSGTHGSTDDGFNYKFYLIVLCCAAVVGCVIGGISMYLTDRRRYFE